MLEQGYSWGEDTEEYLLRHPLLTPFAGQAGDPDKTLPFLLAYESLPADLKEQNRDLARDIPKKLATVGYIARPGRKGGSFRQVLSVKSWSSWPSRSMTGGCG